MCLTYSPRPINYKKNACLKYQPPIESKVLPHNIQFVAKPLKRLLKRNSTPFSKKKYTRIKSLFDKVTVKLLRSGLAS